jgi:phenylacetate-coenzyme A ligase PaaK-like adenylate-forming protein
MAHLTIDLEISKNADEETSRHTVDQAIQNELSLLPEIKVVPSGTLPRFEMKAKRFHVEK